ncbi:MFS transporter [Megasphaera vaginalis (ex Bordigoni et al. 2020)]|uniref:MFS transporter n=1 Tax=Megasphaera vaginalis (ex Bordigoni et al. 2020) TaxID=2045301 RepID=UPI002591A670|nr:MFS transporter [Megasphaera vaginalis (ex Bordigoni et al. 2020)]
MLEVPGGALMTKFGARRWISRIMISWGIVSILTAFVQNDLQFYLVRFALGICEASFFPCMAWYLSNWYQTKNHAKAIAGFMVAIPSASAFGSPISTYLLQMNLFGLHGWQSLFILEAVPSVILGIVVYFYLTDKIEDADWLEPEEREWLQKVVAEEQAVKAEKKKVSFLSALKERDVLILSGGYFAWICGYYGIVMFLPTLVKQLSGTLSTTIIGWTIGAMYLLAAFVMYGVGRHSDKVNERRFHVAACLVAAAIGLVASVYIAHASVVLSLAVYAVALCGAYGAYSPFWAIPPAYLSGTAAAAGIALINSVGNLGGFVGPYVMGYVSTATGSFDAGVLFLAVCMVISALVVTVCVKQNGKALE